MFQFLRNLSSVDLTARQAPVLVVSFLIASLYYRFGSFALETMAFLATWFVLDALMEAVWMVNHRFRLMRSHPLDRGHG